MARNPVQFQKGISLNAFLSLYGTEDQCFDALYQWRWPNGFLCPHCGHDRCCQLNSRKLQQCNRCHRQTSITAGTIFDSTKLALTLWFQAIYLMTQDKKGVSAMKLHRHLGISYNAAWRMRHKLMQVMMERDRAHPLGGSIQLDDAYLGGERSGGKRGRGAPGKTPFVAAVQTNKQGHPLRMKLTVVEGFRLTEIAAWAQLHLGTGTRVIFRWGVGPRLIIANEDLHGEGAPHCQGTTLVFDTIARAETTRDRIVGFGRASAA